MIRYCEWKRNHTKLIQLILIRQRSSINCEVKRSLPGNSKKFEVLLWRPRCVCWKLVNGPMSSFETLVCCDIALSREPRRESRFSIKYAKPPFELPRRRCFCVAVVDESFSLSLRKGSSFVKSLVDFLCFNETTLSLHVLSSVECELCKACCCVNYEEAKKGNKKKTIKKNFSSCSSSKQSFSFPQLITLGEVKSSGFVLKYYMKNRL